jgi:FtsH-binding integral membrane protein
VWTQRYKYVIYFAIVASVSLSVTLLLYSSLRIGPPIAVLVSGIAFFCGFRLASLLSSETPGVLFPLIFLLLIFCQVALLTLPTLAALRFRGRKAHFWFLVLQFIVLVLNLLVNVLVVSRRPLAGTERDRNIAAAVQLCYDGESKLCAWAGFASRSPVH